MRKAKKILIIAGCALLAAAVILFCGGMSAAGWDFSALGTVHYEERTFTAEEEVRSVTVRYETADVCVRFDENAERARVLYPVREGGTVHVSLQDGALTIEEESRFTFGSLFQWDLESPRLTVELPTGTACALDIETDGDIAAEGSAPAAAVRLASGNGDVRAAGLHAADAEFSSANGDVTLEEVQADTVRARSDNGGVTARGAEAETLACRSSNGDVPLENVTAATLEAGSANGDVLLGGEVRAGVFTAETDNGGIRSAEGARLAADRAACRTDNGTIRLQGTTDVQEFTTETRTGDIRILALADGQQAYTLFLNTDTGRANLPSGGSGARRLTAQTDTGDIELQFS